jgi:CBS domain-containing protein
MRTERVRRLPVVNTSGQLQGVLSMNDLLLRAQHCDGANRPGVSYEDVVNTLVAIGLHPAKPKKLLRVAA